VNSMNLCNKEHGLVAFEGSRCPACVVKEERDALRKELDSIALPVSADGVRITPNMPVWFSFGNRKPPQRGIAMPVDKGRVRVRYDEPFNLIDDDDNPLLTDESDPSLACVFATLEAATSHKETSHEETREK
jgi:hypothetical protein